MPDTHDPFEPPETTVLRPRPGAGRRSAGEPLSGRPAGAPPAEFVPPPGAEPAAPGLNPLVQAAASLLRLAGQLRGTLTAPDAGGLRGYVLDEIRRFEDRARSAGIAQETVLAARYVLCAAIDEAVLSTPWGAQSDWAQQTLLVALHGEAWGGERFFAMLERIADTPDRHIDLMELQYLCLAMGFEGRYQVQERGHARLADVRQALYRKIRAHRGAAASELSLKWQGLQDRRSRLVRYVPWWVVGAAAVAILAVALLTYYTRLRAVAAPVAESLSAIGLEAFTEPVQGPSQGPRLKTLLEPEERAGRLLVEEDGGRTLVTLVADDLFASGSATVNLNVRPTLERVADALDQVPGRVMVIGHTDDQPLKSLRYDNSELSRDRAFNVVQMLRSAMENPARLEWTGVGSSQPRFRPESLAGNRARNRRVEILHVSGS
jgi:type VI secretion system protein ImpK